VGGGAPDEWTKFGIAMRETPMAESRYVAMLITPEHGIRSMHRRTFNCGRSVDRGVVNEIPTVPVYFRIQRRGEQLSVFRSEDGTTFEPYGDEETIAMPDLNTNVYVGFLGTAGGVTMPVAQARFDQVTLTTP
jgi:hypothetical protein